jgi:hypothetical protein
LRVQATNSLSRLEITTDGAGVVGHAGAALLRELADRLELTGALGWRAPQGRRRHPDAAVLRDLAVMLADGGDCLRDLAVLRDQPELFGQVASTQPPGGSSNAPPRTPTAGPAAPGPRARPWPRRGRRRLADPQLLVIDADATVVTAHSDFKEGAEGTYKHTFGSTRCWPTWTAGRRLGNHWPACCAQATPPPEPPAT